MYNPIKLLLLSSQRSWAGTFLCVMTSLKVMETSSKFFRISLRYFKEINWLQVGCLGEERL